MTRLLGLTGKTYSDTTPTVSYSEADYFPFGAQRAVLTNLVNNPYQFTGYEYDSGTGYNYAVARFQAGRWGRFLSPDPYLGNLDVFGPQSLNRNTYVLNNPVINVDRFGLDCSAAINAGQPCVVSAPLPSGGTSGGLDPTCGSGDGGSSRHHSPLQDGGDAGGHGGGGDGKGPKPGEDKSTACKVTNYAAAAFAVNAVTFGTAGGVLTLSGAGAPAGVILLMGGAVAGVLSGGFWIGAALAGC